MCHWHGLAFVIEANRVLEVSYSTYLSPTNRTKLYPGSELTYKGRRVQRCTNCYVIMASARLRGGQCKLGIVPTSRVYFGRHKVSRYLNVILQHVHSISKGSKVNRTKAIRAGGC